MHPLARYLIPLGVALLVISVLWWIAGPFVKYISSFWPFLAIAIGVGLLLWRFPTAQAQALLGAPLIRGLATALILTAIYGGLLWLGYVYLPKIMVSELGVSLRTTWLIVTIVGLPVIPIIWRLYAATGIPGDPVAINRGFRALALLILIFMGWWYHHQPNIFFDKNGKSHFWVADTENKTYFRPGNSLTTGEKLRQGTAEDAKKFSQQSWLKDLKLWWHGPASRRQAAAPTSRQWTETVQLQPGVASKKITPPSGVNFWTEGPADCEYELADGRKIPISQSLGIRTIWLKGFRLVSPLGGTAEVHFKKRT